MSKINVLLVVLLSCMITPACSRDKSTDPVILYYDTIPSVQALTPMVNEISGIADSKKNPGFIWGEEDSGNPPQIYLISHSGNVSKKIFIKGAINRDWEDMNLCDGKIYIGEIGDNNRSYTDYLFYRFDEPSASVDTVSSFETIRFVYPDGAHDAEAFFVDPATKDIYIITKRDNPSQIYKLKYPYSTSTRNTAILVGQLDYSGVVSAAISPDSKEILVKTYMGIQRYTKTMGETIEDVLKKKPVAVAGYKMEPQGESIAFKLDNSGFFTLSEKGFASSVNLYFYRRK